LPPKKALTTCSPETAETMIALYGWIVQGELDAADWITAELVKTVENAYRDVQIAFANEVALICETWGGDVWMVRELVNKSPHREMHLPGAGGGGHCIPRILAAGVRRRPRMVADRGRPRDQRRHAHHVVALVRDALATAGRAPAGTRIAVWATAISRSRATRAAAQCGGGRGLAASAPRSPCTIRTCARFRHGTRRSGRGCRAGAHQGPPDLPHCAASCACPCSSTGSDPRPRGGPRARPGLHALGVGSPVPRPADVSAGAGQ
jgi:UDP-glucose 6-dehydrogenase